MGGGGAKRAFEWVLISKFVCVHTTCCLAGQSIFWTDVESDVINRAFWNGSNQQTLVANDLESPAGIYTAG